MWMSNITADGSRLYDSGRVLAKDEVPPDEKDAIFFWLWEREEPETWKDNSRRAEIVRQIEKYASKATEAGVLLPGDDAFWLHVNQDGGWELKIVDFMAARDKHGFDKRKLGEINSMAGGVVVENLDLLRSWLEERMLLLKDEKGAPVFKDWKDIYNYGKKMVVEKGDFSRAS